MAGYSPLKIVGMSAGLVQNREEFILPDDAYPKLINAYVWRERILRKKGFQLLGRLQRSISGVSLSAGVSGTSGSYADVLNDPNIDVRSTQPNANIVPGSVNITVGGITFSDSSTRNGILVGIPGTNSGTINYSTGFLTFVFSPAIGVTAVVVSLEYYPSLPVMGIRTRELTNSANDQTVFFDQIYAYTFNSSTAAFQEFLPGTTWNAAAEGVDGIDFFWSTNYWTSANPPFSTGGVKLFWVTNNSGHSGVNADPPRITDGTTWVDFFPSTWSQIDSGPNYLVNWLCNLPFRGRMVVFNTWEGLNATSAKNYSNRIRWSTIGNPFIPYAAGPPATGSWRDDIRGQGGFLDIPTSEDIVSVGFVRDNLVIYCERSTWQLRYTGRSIAPFQIEKVNSENGAESTFASVQFDTSLMTIGNYGIIQCDSFKAERIDIKIPDFVFQFNSLNNGVARVQGIRDFERRLAYWTIPLLGFYPNVPNTNWIFPTARLVYNYENDSWAIFNDSLTALGTYQQQRSLNWLQIPDPWIKCDFSWLDEDPGDPIIVGGNQQGFIEQLNLLTTNDVSLFISNIVNNGSGIAQITSPNHNMQTGFIIGISGIPATTPFSDLNDGVYSVVVVDQNNFTLLTYDSTSGQFDDIVVGSPAGTYVGGGLINIRENFSVVSKKFNFLDEGQSIQMGYLDILMTAIQNGEISLNMYLDYDDQNPSNTPPKNQIGISLPAVSDTFFNAIIPTSPSTYAVAPQGTKFWQRVFCPTRANFLTLEYTFNNAQMAAEQQELDVQIDAQVLWIRRSGRLTQF